MVGPPFRQSRLFGGAKTAMTGAAEHRISGEAGRRTGGHAKPCRRHPATRIMRSARSRSGRRLSPPGEEGQAGKARLPCLSCRGKTLDREGQGPGTSQKSTPCMDSGPPRRSCLPARFSICPPARPGSGWQAHPRRGPPVPHRGGRRPAELRRTAEPGLRSGPGLPGQGNPSRGIRTRSPRPVPAPPPYSPLLTTTFSITGGSTGMLSVPSRLGRFAQRSTTSMPSMTLPKTVYRPSSRDCRL